MGFLDVLLVAVGVLGGRLRVPWGSLDVPGRLGADFQDLPGNSGRPFGFIFFACSVCYFPGSVFLLIFSEKLHRFWCYVGSYFDIFFWYFPNFAKNAAPHESVVNSNEIVGRAAAKTSNTRYEIVSEIRSKTQSIFK